MARRFAGHYTDGRRLLHLWSLLFMDEEMSVQAFELGFHVYVDVGLALALDTLVSGSFVLLSLADNSELVFSLLSRGLVLLKYLLLCEFTFAAFENIPLADDSTASFNVQQWKMEKSTCADVG
jgi:hypothetical protein